MQFTRLISILALSVASAARVHAQAVRAVAPESGRAPVVSDAAQDGVSRVPQTLGETLRDGRPQIDPLDAEFDALDFALARGEAPFGAQLSAALINPALRPQAPQRYRVNLTPGTGFSERTWVQEAASTTPRPLLVVFHRFGVSEVDAIVTTRLFEEARRRQWHVVAPRSWGAIHFSSQLSKIHTRAVLDWATTNLDVDDQRIYAVGFSMGGGAALNYAATNLGANEPRFAAVAALTPLLDHEHAYSVEVQTTRDTYDDIFGNGSLNSADPYLMRRSGLFQLDPLQQVVPGTDLARNLAHTNVFNLRASSDIPYLMTQFDAFVAHLAGLPLVSAQHTSLVTNFVGHSWDAFDERLVCDWLRLFQLQTPTSGNTLADANRAYFHFDVEQDVSTAFSPFSWNLDGANNTFTLSATANLQSLRVRTLAAGLSNTAPLTITLSAADGLADEVILTDLPLAPVQVLRDGAPTANWMHNSLSGELTLLETDPAQHVWVVTP